MNEYLDYGIALIVLVLLVKEISVWVKALIEKSPNTNGKTYYELREVSKMLNDITTAIALADKDTETFKKTIEQLSRNVELNTEMTKQLIHLLEHRYDLPSK